MVKFHHVSSLTGQIVDLLLLLYLLQWTLVMTTRYDMCSTQQTRSCNKNEVQRSSGNVQQVPTENWYSVDLLGQEPCKQVSKFHSWLNWGSGFSYHSVYFSKKKKTIHDFATCQFQSLAVFGAYSRSSYFCRCLKMTGKPLQRLTYIYLRKDTSV